MEHEDRATYQIEQYRSGAEQPHSRKNAHRHAITAKIFKTMMYVEKKVKIEVSMMSPFQLRYLACHHHNEITKQQTDWDGYLANKDAKRSFLNRIEVNYLRHKATDYEFHLSQVRNRIGRRKAYSAIRNKVLDAIANHYPHLAQECKHQQCKDENALTKKRTDVVCCGKE